MGAVPETLSRSLSELGRRHPGLSVLVLFGSRARDASRPGSDWDFGFLEKGPLDPEQLLADLVECVGSDRVDLVDLARAGGQLRFRVACDGVAVFEDPPGELERFQLEAASFWCDAEPVLRVAYESLLAEVGP